jgi:diguanylate cyclase (GGDEF)-like protein
VVECGYSIDKATMGMSDRQGQWPHQLSLTLDRLGWRSAQVFQVGIALVVGAVVAAVLLSLDHASWGSALLGGLVAAVPALLTGHVALNLARALAQSGEQRELLCVDDELAGVGNRRQFLRLAERDWARCRRYGDDGAMLLIDADYLRRINDTMGQRCGDAVLLEVTRRVSATLRQSDVLARFGGAVLAVFLPHTDPLGALDAAERIRQQVASTPFRWDKAHLVVTVSVGVAHVHAGQMALEGLIQEAETALRAAKDAGRNCVRAAPIQPRQSDPSRSVAPG